MSNIILTQLVKANFLRHCEMVRSSFRSILARGLIKDPQETVLLDEYVKPTAIVTNYRTPWSKIKKEFLDYRKPNAQPQSLQLLTQKHLNKYIQEKNTTAKQLYNLVVKISN